MSKSPPTLDQRRAQHAWKAVEKIRGQNDANDFADEAKRLPVRVKTAGLGQALAFLNAKSNGKDYRDRLLKELGEWLLKERRLAPWPKEASERDAVIQAILNGDANLLRRATEEALLYLQWLTRFSQAEFETGDD